MSANIRAEIERHQGPNAGSPYEIRNMGGERVRPGRFLGSTLFETQNFAKKSAVRPWERVCDAMRSYDRGRCHSTILGPLGRCRVHGGWNYGPKTPEGKARSLAALARINAQRVAARPEAVIRRLAAEGRSLAEIAASVPWLIPKIRRFLIEEERSG
jgi:hypothetical protein